MQNYTMQWLLNLSLTKKLIKLYLIMQWSKKRKNWTTAQMNKKIWLPHFKSGLIFVKCWSHRVRGNYFPKCVQTATAYRHKIPWYWREGIITRGKTGVRVSLNLGWASDCQWQLETQVQINSLASFSVFFTLWPNTIRN